jgi:hypothetical protein
MTACAARKPRAIDWKPRAATRKTSHRGDKNFAPNQETAFQPSGNGISGQAVLLSLAAFGS